MLVLSKKYDVPKRNAILSPIQFDAGRIDFLIKVDEPSVVATRRQSYSSTQSQFAVVVLLVRRIQAPADAAALWGHYFEASSSTCGSKRAIATAAITTTATCDCHQQDSPTNASQRTSERTLRIERSENRTKYLTVPLRALTSDAMYFPRNGGKVIVEINVVMMRGYRNRFLCRKADIRLCFRLKSTIFL